MTEEEEYRAYLVTRLLKPAFLQWKTKKPGVSPIIGVVSKTWLNCSTLV